MALMEFLPPKSSCILLLISSQPCLFSAINPAEEDFFFWWKRRMGIIPRERGTPNEEGADENEIDRGVAPSGLL